MSNNNGGPAFPLQSIGPEFAPGYSGMTLRDYFAAKAMAGELSAQRDKFIWVDCEKDILARKCYSIADAMLAARERNQ